MSLQTLCQIFIGRSRQFGQLILHSLVHDVQSDFIYLAEHPSLLPIPFVSLRFIVIQSSRRHSKALLSDVNTVTAIPSE
jgi:hypothetical protein